RDGVIVSVGRYSDLAGRSAVDEIIGSSDHVVLPGLVNAHHHIGLTPLQRGSLDHPLELWLGSRIGLRDVDLYLDTLYSAFEMVESGVTTVQHLAGWLSGPVESATSRVESVLRAYEAVGMRASYSLFVVDQNRLVYGPDEDFIARLPQDVG